MCRLVLVPNSPELSLLKFLPLTYHHSHFLAATLDFTSFFTMAFLGAAPFFTAWLFLIRLYFLVIWLGAIFSSTQTAVTFGDKDISKCLTNLFLVIKRTNRISLASFSDLQCHAHDQSCCLSGVVFKKLRHQTISKCLYNLFLTVEQTCRISLAGLAIYSMLFM